MILAGHTFIYIAHPHRLAAVGILPFYGYILEIHRRVTIRRAPPYTLALEISPTDIAAHHSVIRIVYDYLGIVKQGYLLAALLVHRPEILLMRRAERRDYPDGRLYYVAQGVHLSRLADSGLKQSHFRILTQQPYR
jgi:hypothetical protein